MTLRQAAAHLKEQGIDIRMGSQFPDFDSWASFFDAHYKAACEKGDFTRTNFFFTDILEIMQ